jgi:5-methylcytosine-specific restriction protein A
MEGHHLIPCTYSNAEYYWSNFKRNIDCVENIVCLCPTCHRRIHFGSKEEQNTIITSLYQKQISSLMTVNLDISIEELLSLYNC